MSTIEETVLFENELALARIHLYDVIRCWFFFIAERDLVVAKAQLALKRF